MSLLGHHSTALIMHYGGSEWSPLPFAKWKIRMEVGISTFVAQEAILSKALPREYTIYMGLLPGEYIYFPGSKNHKFISDRKLHYNTLYSDK